MIAERAKYKEAACAVSTLRDLTYFAELVTLNYVLRFLLVLDICSAGELSCVRFHASHAPPGNGFAVRILDYLKQNL